MDTSRETPNDSQDEEEGLLKYAVSCSCAHGQRPKDAEMVKLADGYKCLACGRLHSTDDCE